MSTDKPAGYTRLHVNDIRRLPSDMTAISLFAGGGGSSLGYRQAGIRVVRAFDFLPHAVQTYAANLDPGVPVVADVSQISDAQWASSRGVDVVDGSPPCQGFSVAGSGDVADTRNDLFAHFVRAVTAVKPRVFVAENVTGMLRGRFAGTLNAVFSAFAAAGYAVTARVLDARWFDVPQRRRRVLFVGFRKPDDLARFSWPRPLGWVWTLQDALGAGFDRRGEVWSVTVRGGKRWVCPIYSGHAVGPIVMATGVARTYLGSERVFDGRVHRPLSGDELIALCSFPRGYVVAGTTADVCARVGNAVPPHLMRAVAGAVKTACMGAAIDGDA